MSGTVRARGVRRRSKRLLMTLGLGAFALCAVAGVALWHSRPRRPSSLLYGLRDLDGQVLSARSYLGLYRLVYLAPASFEAHFPAVLARMMTIRESLAEEAPWVAPMFICREHEPGTEPSAGLTRLLAPFIPAVVGLIDEPEHFDSLGAWFGEWVQGPRAEEEPGEVVIEHGASLYLLDPYDELLTRYEWDRPAEEVATDIAGRVRAAVG